MQSRPQTLTIILTAALTFYISNLLFIAGQDLWWLTQANTQHHLIDYQFYFTGLAFSALIIAMFYGQSWARYAFCILVPLHFFYSFVIEINYYITNWQAYPAIHYRLISTSFWQLIHLTTTLLFVIPLSTQSATVYFKQNSQ
jgi:hypothetical protein